MKCNVCGKHVLDLPEGVYLQRVNPTGEDGIFECYRASNEHALIGAIKGSGQPVHVGGHA